MHTMASHFRKLRHSLRLLPTTKSLGFSTRVNEGDQPKNVYPNIDNHCQSNRDYILNTILNNSQTSTSVETQTLCKKGGNHNSSNQLTDASYETSALVPLSSRDMALVLLPRFTAEGALEPLMSAAKSVSISCDDIIAGPLSSEECFASSVTSMSKQNCVNVLSLSTSNLSIMSQGVRQNRHCSWQSIAEPPGIDYLHLRSSVETDSWKDELSDGVCLFSSSDSGGANKQGPAKNSPSAEQLDYAKDRLEKTVLQMFKGRYDYGMFHKDVVLENNLFGGNKVTKGINAYALEILKLRFRIHARYSSTSIEILNVTTQEQTGVIRIHWRLKCLSQTQVLKFWRLFTATETIKKEDWEWFEAFSYFHIGKDGTVHKHRLDRMIPDKEEPSKLSEELKRFLNPAKPLVN